MADTRLTHDLWLERVPELLDECVEEWSLRLGEPYPLGAAGYAVGEELDDGTPAVLKLWEMHQVPIYSNGIDRELVTPTGAAIAVSTGGTFLAVTFVPTVVDSPPLSVTVTVIG